MVVLPTFKRSCGPDAMKEIGHAHGKSIQLLCNFFSSEMKTFLNKTVLLAEAGLTDTKWELLLAF